MKLTHLFAIFLVSMLLVQCAQMKPITGGAKDVTSPQIVQSSPQNFTTGFQGHTLAMEFDEYVVVKNLSSELVVSPPLKYPITHTIKGKRIFFKIQDTLIENTTYNFNFGKAIVDLNEGNPLDSNLIVFSTGLSLDSGEISGVVIDAYTQKSMKATVLLYDATDDSAIYNGHPSYITQSKDDGSFKLQYLAERDYQIFVLETPGTDYNYLPFGKIGFNDVNVHPNSNEDIDFFVFKEIDTTQYISKSISKEYYSYILGFKNPLINPVITFIPSSDSVNYIVEEIKSDSFLFWIEGDLGIDSVTTFISDDNGYLDTITLALKDRTDYYKKLKRKKKKINSTGIGLNTSNGQFDYFDSLQIKFSRPIQSWKPDSIYFVNGADTTRLDSLIAAGEITMRIPFSKKGTTAELRSMQVNYDWLPNQKYALIFYPGAYKDIIGQTNDTLTKSFSTRSFEDYGSFRFTVNVANYTGPLVLELLDDKGKFLRDYYIHSGDVIYHELARPGKYNFRVIIDENDNKIWDTGNLKLRVQPEKMVYHTGVVEIRPNWDMEETWNVEFTE